MVRFIKQLSLLVMLLTGWQNAGAFALLGPNNEAYQDPPIGYNPNPNIDGAPIGPKNIGEEYRRNTPVLYYSFDQSFLDFFGSNGVAAVEAAFETINGLTQTNISAYSADLSEFPLEAVRVNYRAQALRLTDLKSTVMNLVVEQMGLTHPDRYVWTIHGREHFGNVPCPVGMEYTIIKRNFDPVMGGLDQLLPTSYVNGTLYSYRIVEYCDPPNSPIPPLIADATEFPVDPLATTFTAVAAGNIAPILYGGIAFTVNAGQLVGAFYTGLTRDDVGGLRYLMRTNNMNIEGAGPDTITFVTNTAPQLLFTSNLLEFVNAALINGPAALNALYPNLLITSTTPIFTNVVTTNLIFYFTNYPFEPAGTLPHLLSQTVIETNVTTYFSHTFGNAYITPSHQLVSNLQVPVVPGHSASSAIVGTITTNISSSACGPFSPAGMICTNVSISQAVTLGAFGDFYILPTNLCAVSIVSTQLIRTITITNPPIGVIVGFTNAAGEVVGTESIFSQSLYYSYNQYVYVVRPVVCPEDSIALRQGIERIRYERRDFDSLFNQFYYPQTNDYVLRAITNNTIVPQSVRRVSLVPDILFTASDLAGGPNVVTLDALQRTLSFVTSNALPNLAGPGTIISSTVMNFNKVGPIFGNIYPGLGEDTQIPLLLWGSFDGSTNAPVVYPNGTSIVNVENQVLIQITPSGPALPAGTVGMDYTNAFTGFVVNGGTAPYQWSLAEGSPGLPPGLHLNAATGAITGVPTTAHVYDFTLRLTDAGTRFVDRSYSLTVIP